MPSNLDRHSSSPSLYATLQSDDQVIVPNSIADLTRELRFDRTTAGSPDAIGGYSDVYQATWDRPSGEVQVAIKILRARHTSSRPLTEANKQDRVTQRMRREMRVWIRAQHPRIIPLFGHAILAAGPSLVSPWYTNGNITEFLRSNPDADRRALLSQVAEGLVFLHNSNPVIIHSDIKGSNVLISDSGEAELCDFGLSKILDDTPSELTSSGLGAGTLRWMAPELLDGQKPTTQSDIYSFGCLVLEVMTGKLPFVKQEFMVAIIDAKRTRGIEPADYPEIDQTDLLWSIILECCARDPALRPTADQVLERLQVCGPKASAASN
ncbi:hypothetical protein FRB99_000109 [Tulasnella sp. 403]|nr:hypothetical protein FRB99_000109 [Tulasnella sp. 403]